MSPVAAATLPLAADALSVLVFAALIAAGAGAIPAALAATALGLAMAAWRIRRGAAIPPLQALSLALVLIGAGATLVTGDPRFVMAKPTLIYGAVAVAMLRRGWMSRYVPAGVAPDLVIRFGTVWAGLMAVIALANAVIAIAATVWWPVFIGVFPLAAKLALFLIQVVSLRVASRRRAARGSLGSLQDHHFIEARERTAPEPPAMR